MYENQTFEIILGRMLDRVPNNRDKREGSVIWDALAPAAVELQLMYIEFDNIMNNAYGDTAVREFLIRICKERGITPYTATKAVLRGEFTPITINMTGKRFNVPNENINYIVGDIISDGVYQVECETAGEEGNTYLGNIIPIDNVAHLQRAELTALLIPAENEEETERLRRRYFDSFNVKAFGGNIRDYVDKVNSIDGVGFNAVKVTPCWNGGGTVKITFLDSQYNLASDVLIDKVQQIIDPTQDGQGLGLAPIGHVVTVETAVNVTIDIRTKITLAMGKSRASLQQQITNAVQSYFGSLRENWAAYDNPFNNEKLIIRVSQIDTRILSIDGVIDVTDTRLNGDYGNMTLSKYEAPVFGGVVLDS